jgi:uncharacterized 2Fe-2S/4Fe-4S cluster protein (DUF4445 family)
LAKAPGPKCRVHFDPGNVEVVVDQGTNLLEAAAQAGIRLVAACGGSGTCGTCKVQLVSGELETTRTAKLSPLEFQNGLRQACQSRVLTDVRALVPVESRLESAVMARESKRAASKELVSGWSYLPQARKYFIALPPPTIADNVSDLSRLLRGLKQEFNLENLSVDFEVVAHLPRTLRQDNWRATVTALTIFPCDTDKQCSQKIIRVEAGDTRERQFSLAIDIGTTTVKGQLLDLNRGRIVAEAAELNGETVHGADVITRIAYCQKPGGLRKMQALGVQTVNSVINQMLSESTVSRSDIAHATVSGNTTMLQIFLGMDPAYIRLSPYTPTATFLPEVKAGSLGLDLPGHVYLSAFPNVASYIGGDIVSGIVASGVHQTSRVTFYIDIGTNGQIVVGNKDWMVTAACSAGPAFEGGEIKHGMIATAGAIEGCEIAPDTLEPTLEIIGDQSAKGICGSGLINTVAELLEKGIINRNGRFNTEIVSPRIRQGNDKYEYVLAWADQTQTGKDIVITEIDIDNLMRAKAAMYAGFQTLVKSVGLAPPDIEQIIIAGAFGSYINVDKAITIGLLPDLPRERFIFIGNGSLMGARLAEFSIDILRDINRVAGLMTNLELSENHDFMNNYVAALFLPHTNCNEFASVCERLPEYSAKQGAD